MSHNYLFDTYHYLDERRAAAREALAAAGADRNDKRFAEGRLEALSEFQSFIHDHINPKLPRRLFKQLTRMRGE